MQLHDKQKEIVRSLARFKVVRAGRKAGKTAMEVENICFKAMTSASNLNLTKDVFPSGRKVLYIAPTQDQARNIIWEALKTKLEGIGKPNEQKLQMKVPNEDGTFSTIYVGGWENRENYRGLADVVHITFDETDTLKKFFISWLEIFRPMFIDTGGTANFIGTPKKENPNMKYLEKDFTAKGQDFASFKFTSRDNPHLSVSEIDALEKEYSKDRNTYIQEVLAEYVEDTGALFSHDAVIDIFSNTIVKSGQKYLIIDVSAGGDTTVFSYWEDLEEYAREEYEGMVNHENFVNLIRDKAILHKIPHSHIAVDAIGIGENIPKSPLLTGIIGFKSSYSAIKTEASIITLPNVSYVKDPPRVTDFPNLRSQCIFKLASLVNNHEIASKVGGQFRENIIEELPLYQVVSKGDGKRQATSKDDIKILLGRSPDHSDTYIMRMYFEIVKTLIPGQSEDSALVIQKMNNQFLNRRNGFEGNSNR